MKGRKKRSKTGQIAHDKMSQKNANSYREPWLLVSSLKKEGHAKKIVQLYKQRMTIEESFRDTKSAQYGLSMNDNKTIKPKRYSVWLILAALASLIAWIYGYCAEQAKLHFDFQANTYKHRRVPSYFYLGCQIIRKKIKINICLNRLHREAWGASL